MNKITLIFLLIPIITFAGDQSNLFICDTLKYGVCQKKPYDPNSQVMSSHDLVRDVKLLLTGRKNKIENLANFHLINGRIDFARSKERESFYYGLISLLIDQEITLLNRDDLEDYIFVWCSEEMLKQIDVVLSEAETKDKKKIIQKMKKKVQKQIKKRGY